jgi:hypothetical protein
MAAAGGHRVHTRAGAAAEAAAAWMAATGAAAAALRLLLPPDDAAAAAHVALRLHTGSALGWLPGALLPVLAGALLLAQLASGVAMLGGHVPPCPRGAPAGPMAFHRQLAFWSLPLLAWVAATGLLYRVARRWLGIDKATGATKPGVLRECVCGGGLTWGRQSASSWSGTPSNRCISTLSFR